MGKLKLILILCMLIILSSVTFAITTSSWCYQESANDSTIFGFQFKGNPTLIINNSVCNQIFNGTYGFTAGVTNPDSGINGNWSLFSGISNLGENVTINYTKPPNLLGATWMVGGQAAYLNHTIPDICFDAFPDKISLKVIIGPGASLHLYCWNTTDFNKIAQDDGTAQLREESMWWNVTDTTNLSLTFIDEILNTLIGGETFSVFLEKSDFSQTYSTTDNPFVIPNLVTDLYTKLKVSSVNYPERQYLNIDLRGGTRSSPVNFTVYLINTTDSSEITFNIVDEGLNPLDDVRAVFVRTIDGTPTVIAEEDSDFAGQVVVTLDENNRYTINFSKTNYEDKTIELEPKNSEYVIKMISTIGAYNQSVHEGIRYSFSPKDTVLNNNTRYNFTFTLNSTVWPLTNCTLRLRNGTLLLNETSSFISNSCFIRIERGTFSMTNITAEGIYELDSEFEFTVTHNYKVIYTYVGEFSLKNFLDDLSDFGMAGFDDFGRMILALIVIFIITALAAQKIGFTNPEVLILLVIAQVWFFSSVNWLFLDFTPIPTILHPVTKEVIFDLKKYIIAILITLAGGAFLIEKFTK